ncbi:hypothetical protein MY04_1198 [Flammeovirga sp. MY04]|uniref:hypothetical protein n=1 Tax=Flammeovirga sp. MY04 TaxID=1191459 RepID=UPI00080623AD|nr:hypothetical protein [Flammeovirga sp. MY04]ANQ48575.1 hypothetical protein MY04_1198 [Flammeovirga sp. MY04]
MRKYFLILLLASSCNSHRLLYHPEGKWIFNYQLHENLDSSVSVYTKPILIEFDEGGKLIFSQLGFKESTNTWLVNDDTLIYNSNKSIIKKLKRDSLILKENNDYYYFSRPKKRIINQSKTEIESILQTNIWMNDQGREVEYFNNNTMIESDITYNYNLEDTTKSITLNNWGIAEFNQNYYLFYYKDLATNSGTKEAIYQLHSVTKKSFSFVNESGKIISYYKKKEEFEKDQSLFKGKWVSRNSKDKRYRRYARDLYSKDESMILFDGDLIMEISDSILTFQIDTLRKIEYNWRINKENNILFLDKKTTLDNGKEIVLNIDYIYLNSVSTDLIKSRLENYILYDELDDQKSYLLNIYQDFQKVK